MKILQFFWNEIKMNDVAVNSFPKGTVKHEDQNMFVDQVMEIPDEVRDAVLEKWLTYVKSENLTEWIIWRKRLMNKRFTRHDNLQMKIALDEGRKKDTQRVFYADENEKNINWPTGMCNRDPNQYGERVNKIFPLLDPDLTEDERILRHKTWFVDAPDNAKFLSQLTGWDDSKICQQCPAEIGATAPSNFCFLPSLKVMIKLVTRAT